MTDVFVESVEIVDLGAQARGNKVFGIKIGDERHLSFEVHPDDYDSAVTFMLLGTMEGLRYWMHNGVLKLPSGRVLRANYGEEGFVLVDQDGEPTDFPDWGTAMAGITELGALDSEAADTHS